MSEFRYRLGSHGCTRTAISGRFGRAAAGGCRFHSVASRADPALDCPRCRTGSEARQELDQLLETAFGHASARQGAAVQAQVATPTWRPTRPCEARTGTPANGA